MAGKTVLSRCQSERGGKRFRDAEQFDRHQTRSCMHVASEALLPVPRVAQRAIICLSNSSLKSFKGTSAYQRLFCDSEQPESVLLLKRSQSAGT